jgi:hypothetical protein
MAHVPREPLLGATLPLALGASLVIGGVIVLAQLTSFSPLKTAGQPSLGVGKPHE